MKYYIQNNGCDDRTELIIDLTDEEVKVFAKICKELNKKSSYQCQPEIALYKYDDCEFDDDGDIFTMTASNLLEEE